MWSDSGYSDFNHRGAFEAELDKQSRQLREMKAKIVNRVYMVVEVQTTPYGEPMGDGATLGVFRSRKSANAYKRELIECDEFNGGHQPTYAVRSFKLED